MKDRSAFEAIESGDMGRFMMAFARGANPNARDESDRTLLLAACEHPQDRHGFVQVLLENRASATLKGPLGKTPLHALANKRELNVGTLEILVDSGAALNEKDQDGCTVLHAFAERGWIQGCTSILDAASRPMDLINEKDHRGRTPLWCASDHPALTCMLISYGADPRIADHEGHSPAQMVTDVHARLMVMAQIKALIKSDAARAQVADLDDPELADIVSQSKAILAKGYLRQAITSGDAGNDNGASKKNSGP